MKRLIFILIIGGIGGVLLNNLVLPVLIEINFLGSANLLKFLVKPQAEIMIRETERVVTVEPDFWKEVVPKVERSTIFVQYFSSAGTLISQSNGITLTNDGLIVVPLNTVPKNFSTAQIFITGKILKGSLATIDSASNLALIKVDDSSLPILDFVDLNGLLLGQHILIIGKKIDVSEVKTFAHTSLITEITGQVFFIDLERGQQRGQISGAPAVDSKGKLIGMIQIDSSGQVFIMPYNFLKDLLEKYLSQAPS